ncbi:MAG: class I tRNA ligase family protein, partial [Myxococcota bacterium]
MSGDPFYITTPIYYVNGKPHIGHAYTTIAADSATRYHRMMGRPARFLTGTDEHGQKVLEAAEARGLTPKAHVDDLVPAWKAMMASLDISFDRFIRTTDDDHVAVVQKVLSRLDAQGLIYKDTYEGWYLVTDEVFVTDKDREAQIKAGAKTEADFKRVTEANYFFRMSQFQQPLIDHIEANPDFIVPESRRNEVLGFLRNELGDLCISRPKERMSWGIELPFDTDYVCYVWFDALLNYLTGAGYTAEEGDARHEAWWPALHLIGKDILTTHS